MITEKELKQDINAADKSGQAIFLRDRDARIMSGRKRKHLRRRAETTCSPWRIMTPNEYARDYTSFPPHRAEVSMSIQGVPASAEVSVFIVSAGNE